MPDPSVIGLFCARDFIVKDGAGVVDKSSMELSTVAASASSALSTGNVQSQIAMAVLKQVQDASLQQAEALVKMVQESSGIGRHLSLIA